MCLHWAAWHNGRLAHHVRARAIGVYIAHPYPGREFGAASGESACAEVLEDERSGGSSWLASDIVRAGYYCFRAVIGTAQDWHGTQKQRWVE